MNWIEKVQNSSDAKKKKVIMTVIFFTAVILLGIWILCSSLRHRGESDKTLLNTFSQGLGSLGEKLRNVTNRDGNK